MDRRWSPKAVRPCAKLSRTACIGRATPLLDLLRLRRSSTPLREGLPSPASTARWCMKVAEACIRTRYSPCVHHPGCLTVQTLTRSIELAPTPFPRGALSSPQRTDHRLALRERAFRSAVGDAEACCIRLPRCLSFWAGRYLLLVTVVNSRLERPSCTSLIKSSADNQPF